jgi:hypothetical protein
MFSKCANPECVQGFDYRLGRVIRFHNDEPREGPVGAVSGTFGFATTARVLTFSNIKASWP